MALCTASTMHAVSWEIGTALHLLVRWPVQRNMHLCICIWCASNPLLVLFVVCDDELTGNCWQWVKFAKFRPNGELLWWLFGHHNVAPQDVKDNPEMLVNYDQTIRVITKRKKNNKTPSPLVRLLHCKKSSINP
uniref:ARAD1C16742p n=1 Tax=Blastobotrys adeninivorans TaxID=409370 RepID=A0A060T104_BLAAD